MLVEFDGTGIGVSGMPLSATHVNTGWVGKQVHLAGFGSGGPLLLLDDAGWPSVLGVLSRGSSGCLGLDVYTLTSALTPWLSEQPTAETCGALP
jgi:hypothetical protein